MSKNEQYQQIAAECAEAVECARRGEPHPRLGSMVERTLVEYERRAAMPRQQIVKGGLMPPTRERQADDEQNGYLKTGGTGPGWSVRSD